MHKNKLNSSDAFLSYADDEFENYINVEMFRAIVNLYALISDRIVIADSFFINNRIVHDFFENTPDGLKYIENGIIIPLLRDSVAGFNELYSCLYERKTVKREIDHKYIEKIDGVANKSFFKWSENIISKNFTDNILKFFNNEIYFEKFKLNGERKKILNDIGKVAKNGVLYRQDVISTIKENNKISPDLKNEIINVVDILYNYNIPEYYGLTVAYPDFIHEKSKLIKEIFFREQQVNFKHNLLRKQDSEINTLIFDYGLLSSLNAEQVVEIRKTSEYKKYISIIRELNTNYKYEEYINLFSKYNDKINKLIPLLIDKEIYCEILKRKKLLTITEKIFEYFGDIVSVSLGLVINDFAFSIGTTLFLRGLSMAFKKYQSKQEEALEDLKFNGKDKLRKVESGIDIFEKLSKDFKLNISEGKISKEGA